jgi:1-acyl-sn-glycerol-3-phosphate acyltransferase
MRAIRGWLTFAVFTFIMLAMTVPEIYARRFWHWWRGHDVEVKRATEIAWQAKWSERFWELAQVLMGIRMSVHIESDVKRGLPYIIAINHRTFFDHVVADLAIRETGARPALWVLKSAMRWVPGIGGWAKRSGAALVSRNRDPEDRQRISATAQICLENTLSTLIYPEGTRHDGNPRPEARYGNVCEPRVGGMKVLMAQMPETPILFVCLDWSRLKGGRTITDMSDLVGFHGRIHVWQYERKEGEDVARVLGDAWQKMDDTLSADPVRSARQVPSVIV